MEQTKKQRIKIFFLHFLFLNVMAFTGASLIFLFQYLIGLIKETVFYKIEATWYNFLLYALFILLCSGLEFVLLLRKQRLRKLLHTQKFLLRHPLLSIITDVMESMFCCFLTFLLALPLGSEGPSVYIGFMVENFFVHLLFKKKTTLEHNHYGSMMGYGLAFLNPLAGLCFYFEKKNRRGTTKEIYSQVFLMVVSFLWLLLWRYLYGIKDFYLYGLYNRQIYFFSAPKLHYLLLLIPLLTMTASFFFKRFIVLLSYFVKENETQEVLFSLLMAMVSILSLKFTGNYDMMGFADEIFLSSEEILLLPALVFFFIRFFWTIMNNDVYYLGGHVIPTLVVGGSIGMVLVALISPHYALTYSDRCVILIVSALSFFASVTLNYVTTLALSFSFGPGFILIPYLILPLTMVYLIATFFHRPSLPQLLKKVSTYNHRANRAMLYHKTLTYK